MGPWFPNQPKLLEENSVKQPVDRTETLDRYGRIQMGVERADCDDAKVLSDFPIYYIICFFFSFIQTRLEVDYDETNSSHHIAYLCIGDKDAFKSNYDVQPVMTEYQIPPMYNVSLICPTFN